MQDFRSGGWSHSRLPLYPPPSPPLQADVPTSHLLLLQTVNKNIFSADLTKLLGQDAFTQAPRLVLQMMDCSEKGKVSPPSPSPVPPCPPPLSRQQVSVMHTVHACIVLFLPTCGNFCMNWLLLAL